MFRTRTFLAILLAVASSVIVFEVRINLSGNVLATKAAGALSLPGARLIAALYAQNAALVPWPKFWEIASLVCNFLVYTLFWYACVWLIGYLRSRQHPYDRQPTMLYH